jgi:hypothetical protein
VQFSSTWWWKSEITQFSGDSLDLLRHFIWVLYSKSHDPFWCGNTNIVFLQSGHNHVGKFMAYVWWFISCYLFQQWISGSYWWLALCNWFILLELKAYAVLSSLFSWRHTVELQQKMLGQICCRLVTYIFSMCLLHRAHKIILGFRQSHTLNYIIPLSKMCNILAGNCGYSCDLFKSHIQSKGIFSWTTYKTENIF